MKILSLIFLCFSLKVFNQVYENFEYMNIDNWTECINNRWGIDSLTPISGKYSLKHIYNNNESGIDQILLKHNSLYLDSAESSWNFKIRYKYNPSANNNWQVLLSEYPNLCELHSNEKGTVYIIGVNFKGYDDLLKVWKVEDANTQLLTSSFFNWQESVGNNRFAEIKIHRSVDGIWNILIDTTETSLQYDTVIEFSDVYPNHLSAFGIYYEYTSTQDMKIWMDDLEIQGHFIEDIIPPARLQYDFYNQNTLRLVYDENLDFDTSGAINSIFLNGQNSTDSIWIDKNLLFLQFENSFNDLNEYTLILPDICDYYDNCISDSLSFIYNHPKQNDLILTEIMADPNPKIMLPEEEYLELYNRSDYPVQLNQWQLEIGNRICTLPYYYLKSDSFLLIIDQGTSQLFSEYTSNITEVNLPSITNTGTSITLKNNYGETIHWVEYNDDWYNNDYKSDGGWSLEMIDLNNPCGEQKNWTASEDPSGGTPGKQNSVNQPNPDISFPEIIAVSPIDNRSINIYFNETIDSISFTDYVSFEVDHGIGSPSHVMLNNPEFKSATLIFEESFDSITRYLLTLTGNLIDCIGNTVESNQFAVFGLPSKPKNLDIIINEVLYEANDSEVEFIELYNRSTKIINLSEIELQIYENNMNELKSTFNCAHNNRLIFPDEYIVITKNKNNLCAAYFCHNSNQIIENNTMSQLSNRGSCINLTYENISLDMFCYSSHYHNPLLNSTRGISLERISPEVATNHQSNWYSASEIAGFATPGYKNSQSYNEFTNKKFVEIIPKKFSPDNDGIDDYITIKINNTHPGMIANIYIFNPSGKIICQLANNLFLGTNEELAWDGRKENNSLAEMGIYLIYIELIDERGNIEKFKETCVLTKQIR